jgi:hypothetical protein
MTMLKTMLAGGAAVAALGLAAPASAQWANPYNPNPYASPYATPYGYGYNQQAHMTQIAAQQCTAAVQHRLNNRVGLESVLARVVGIPTTQARVLNVTQVNPRRTTVRVQGLASSGRHAYNPWGVGAYGAVGMAYQPDLRFRCDVDYRGRIRSVDIRQR